MEKKFIKMDLKAILLAVLVFFVAALLTFQAFAQASVGAAETKATQSVVRDQLLAFKTGDHNRAYSHAAPNIKNYFSTVDRFVAMVKSGYGAIYHSDSFVMGRNTLISGEVYQEVIITDPSGKQWQAVYTLKQQDDGEWKISGVKMEPYKGAST